jgi:hypothetical protein
MDIKDTNGYKKIKTLKDVFRNSFRDSDDDQRIRNIQTIRSYESQILQIADIIMGAVGYEQRVSDIKKIKPDFVPNPAKVAICDQIKHKFGSEIFNKTSPGYFRKFNLFIWGGQEC